MPMLKVTAEQDGQRLDVVLAQSYPQYSRSFLQKVVKSGGVRRQGAAAASSERVQAGELLEVVDLDSLGRVAQPVRAGGPAGTPVLEAPPILHEDEALLVIHKPAGLVVHPAPGHRGSTLVDWLRGHLGPSVAKVFTDPERLGLVHRLDKDTSGVLLIAKTITAQTAVSRQFRDRLIRKTYAAFVEGVPAAARGVISAPVGRSRQQPSLMAVSPSGRPSETAFEVVESYGGEVSQVSLFPKTGRTHQLRVHLSALGHPIVGDHAYGSRPLWRERCGILRTLLHAERLELVHPLSGRPVAFQAPWPDDFVRARERFRAWAAGLLLGVALAAAPLAAEPARTPPPKPAATGAGSAKTGAPPSAQASATQQALRTLRKEVSALRQRQDALQQEVSGLQGQLSAVLNGFEQLNAARRLRDLEQAVAEINGKAVTSAASAEETKTQLMEAQRRLRNQQELLEQLRDQLDRLQRDQLQRRGQLEPAPPRSDEAGPQP